MPTQPSTKSARSKNIQRRHSGCKSCRRRGKKCDETKPRCHACTRLSLECSYGVDFSFRHLDGASFQQYSSAKRTSSQAITLSNARTPVKAPSDTPVLGHLSRLPAALSTGDELEISYWSHFRRHVQNLLPAASLLSSDEYLQSSYFRFAVLCISASNLSMLNARVQSRVISDDNRKSIFSPLVNHLHHRNAQTYHDQALWLCHAAESAELKSQAPALLAAQVLLAYYHHASTDHLRFRHAVWDSVRFVLQNRETLLKSTDGANSLQMWYRLCMSHRLAKPPALLLEGEGASSFGPNRFPDTLDHLYLRCIRGMSPDDLIYDILIKTMEIRTRLVVFRCVAGSCRISELSSDIGSVAHEILNKMLGRDYTLEEWAEARGGFVRGAHLLGLLDVQEERLNVWKSRLNENRLPANHLSNPSMPSPPNCGKTFPTHRDTMNALYCMLCEMMFVEAHSTQTSHEVPPAGQEHPTSALHSLAHNMCQIIDTLDFTTSNTSDVYTFSLAETLLQLVFVCQSEALFHYVLDVIWPRLELKTRGYEHSHYPTHLVKRIITQISVYWAHSRIVNHALPAVPEDVSKLKLLDIHHPVDLVVCGYDKDEGHFIEKIPLP